MVVVVVLVKIQRTITKEQGFLLKQVDDEKEQSIFYNFVNNTNMRT